MLKSAPTHLKKLPIFYDARAVADSQSYSPSAGKPAAVVESWKALGIPLEIAKVHPVSVAQLKSAHDPAFVDAIMLGTKKNGFGNRLPEVNASLPYTSGAMLCAAKRAIKNKRVAVAPCSGFHHARYDQCHGFCTFNGLIVTAQALKAEGLVNRLGILDFDMHEGDGTDDCIDRLHLSWIKHFTAGKTYDRPEQAQEFLARIPALVKDMSDCDLILYQAGADPHINDPLGGWLNDEQLYQRDLLVFMEAAKLKVPIVFCLAGGYQQPLRKVLNIHDRTIQACWSVHGVAA